MSANTCGSCCSCDAFDDTFDRADSTNLGANWTETSGNSDITSNALRFNAITNGVALYNQTVTPFIVISGVVRFGTTGDIARVYFDWVDASNFWCAEFKCGTGGYTKIIQCVAGAETDQASVSPTTPNASATDLDFEVCITDFAIRAIFFNTSASHPDTNDPHMAACYATITPSGTFGLGTGGTCAGAVSFKDLRARRTDATGGTQWFTNGSATTGVCLTCVKNIRVTEGYSPYLEAQVTISGIVDGTCSTCDSALNGTFILPMPRAGTQWALPITDCAFSEMRVQMGVVPFTSNTVLQFEILFENGAAHIMTFKKTYVGTPAFSSIGPAENIPFDSQNGGRCDGSTATVAITFL